MDGNVKAVNQTLVFLRLAAIELRRIADMGVSVADDLRHVADQCICEAEDLAKEFGIQSL